MILLSHVAECSDIIDVVCSVCGESVAVPCELDVVTEEHLSKLLTGTFNAKPCPTCGTRAVADRPVDVDIPELGIGLLKYAPLYMLEHDMVCEEFLKDNQYHHYFYSLDELARQIRARLLISNFQINLEAASLSM